MHVAFVTVLVINYVQSIYVSEFRFVVYVCASMFTIQDFKGIVQPFELGGETRLIRSAVGDRPFKKKFFNDTIPREELKTE
jgi:hypothetical protein